MTSTRDAPQTPPRCNAKSPARSGACRRWGSTRHRSGHEEARRACQTHSTCRSASRRSPGGSRICGCRTWSRRSGAARNAGPASRRRSRILTRRTRKRMKRRISTLCRRRTATWTWRRCTRKTPKRGTRHRTSQTSPRSMYSRSHARRARHRLPRARRRRQAGAHSRRRGTHDHSRHRARSRPARGGLHALRRGRSRPWACSTMMRSTTTRSRTRSRTASAITCGGALLRRLQRRHQSSRRRGILAHARASLPRLM